MKAQLVTVGWRHGKEYGGHLAACMVMSCLMNRVKRGWGTVLEVIDNIPKHAATLEVPTGTPSIWEPGFVRLLHEVEGIYDGTMDFTKGSKGEGALYWCDTRNVTTPFFLNKILHSEEHPRIADMNSLAFYR